MAAFQKLYEEYARPVYQFLLTLTGNEHLAEDLLQETFYQAFLHIDKFEGRCNLYTWLCQIGKNAWLKECRRKSRYSETAWDSLDLPAREPSPEEHAITADEYRRAIKAVRLLAEPYREVFALHAIGGVKLKEIAVLFNKTETWARVTYFRAKQKILQEVDK